MFVALRCFFDMNRIAQWNYDICDTFWRERRSSPLFRQHIFNEAEVRSPEGGFVIGLSVDEAGKAEGYHERLPDSPVMILADEAKSIRDDVFTSLARCTATGPFMRVLRALLVAHFTNV